MLSVVSKDSETLWNETVSLSCLNNDYIYFIILHIMIIIMVIVIILIIIIIYIINLIVLHLGGHHTEELGELDHAVPILVKLVYQVLKMCVWNDGFECK